MCQDDSDMKIASNLSTVTDSSDGAAYAYLRETHNGNMKKARLLGGQFAAELTSESAQSILQFGVGAFDDMETLRQRQVLFAYLAGKAIEDVVPNSIVAQSAVSAFFEQVAACAPALYERIIDSAANSLYMLADRSAPGDFKALGCVFARLCDREDDDVFVRYGCELARYFSMYCTQVTLRIQLVR